MGGFFAAGGHGFSEPAREPFLPRDEGCVFKGLLFDWGGFGFSWIGSYWDFTLVFVGFFCIQIGFSSYSTSETLAKNKQNSYIL